MAVPRASLAGPRVRQGGERADADQPRTGAGVHPAARGPGDRHRQARRASARTGRGAPVRRRTSRGSRRCSTCCGVRRWCSRAWARRPACSGNSIRCCRSRSDRRCCILVLGSPKDQAAGVRAIESRIGEPLRAGVAAGVPLSPAAEAAGRRSAAVDRRAGRIRRRRPAARRRDPDDGVRAQRPRAHADAAALRRPAARGLPKAVRAAWVMSGAIRRAACSRWCWRSLAGGLGAHWFYLGARRRAVRRLLLLPVIWLTHPVRLVRGLPVGDGRSAAVRAGCVIRCGRPVIRALHLAPGHWHVHCFSTRRAAFPDACLSPRGDGVRRVAHGPHGGARRAVHAGRRRHRHRRALRGQAGVRRSERRLAMSRRRHLHLGR